MAQWSQEKLEIQKTFKEKQKRKLDNDLDKLEEHRKNLKNLEDEAVLHCQQLEKALEEKQKRNLEEDREKLEEHWKKLKSLKEDFEKEQIKPWKRLKMEPEWDKDEEDP